MTTGSKRELPVSFDIVREKNLQQLKLLNSVIFPIKFPVSARMLPPLGGAPFTNLSLMHVWQTCLGIPLGCGSAMH